MIYIAYTQICLYINTGCVNAVMPVLYELGDVWPSHTMTSSVIARRVAGALSRFYQIASSSPNWDSWYVRFYYRSTWVSRIVSSRL